MFFEYYLLIQIWKPHSPFGCAYLFVVLVVIVDCFSHSTIHSLNIYPIAFCFTSNSSPYNFGSIVLFLFCFLCNASCVIAVFVVDAVAWMKEKSGFWQENYGDIEKRTDETDA